MDDYQYEYHYVNYCWDCHSKIDSRVNKRCHLCGWYICDVCFSCDRLCFGRISPIPSVRKRLRKVHEATSVPSSIDIIAWGTQFLDDESAQEKERVLREQEKLINEKAVREAKLQALDVAFVPNAAVISKAFGEGVIIGRSPSADGKDTVLRVRFPIGERRFIFPRCVDDGFLTLKTSGGEPNTNG